MDQNQPAQPANLASYLIFFLLGCFCLYVGLFVAVFVDEVYLQTNFFVSYLPDKFGEYFRIIYWPVLRLFRFI